MNKASTTDKKAVRKSAPKPDESSETAGKTPSAPDEKKKTTDKKAVRVIRTRAELDGGLVLSLSMKTDTPELPANVAEALSTLNLVDIK
jgi:hypothetical protein